MRTRYHPLLRSWERGYRDSSLLCCLLAVAPNRTGSLLWVRSSLISSRHSPADARLQRWSRWFEAIGDHRSVFALAMGPGIVGMVRFLFAACREVRKTTVCVLPDPELHLAYPLLRVLAPETLFVLDVHEDYQRTAAIRPGRIPWLTRRLVDCCSLAYRHAQSRGDVVVVAAEIIGLTDALLVDNGNDAEGIAGVGSAKRIAYIGDVTPERGAVQMLDLARLLTDFEFEIVGRVSVDNALATALLSQPNLRLHGELPFDEALLATADCGIGLSLLQDLEPYREALPTKLLDYGFLGMFMVVTPLPGQARFVNDGALGHVMRGFDVAQADVAAVRAAGMMPPRERSELAERSRTAHRNRQAKIENQRRQLFAHLESERNRRVSARWRSPQKGRGSNQRR